MRAVLFFIFYFFKKYYQACLSGLLVGLSFVPFPFFTLFFALIPLWLFIYKQNKLKPILIACFLCQFFATLVASHWVLFTVHYFGQFNWFLSFIAMLLFCAFAHSYFMLAGLCWFILTKYFNFKLPVLCKLLLFPFLFSLFHELIPMIFPWNMGYPWLWANMPGLQTAELWGMRFLNTLFYIFNFLFLIVYKHRWDLRAKQALFVALALFAFLNILGWHLKDRLAKPDASLNVILVQNNLGSLQSSKAKTAHQAFLISKNLTYQAINKYAKTQKEKKNINFILWSEGSYHYLINKGMQTDKRLSSFVKDIQIPLLTGGISKDKRAYGGAAFVLDRQGRILQPVYNKIKLLIFGEYFPGIDQLDFLKKLFPYFGSSLTPGKTTQVQNLENVNLAWQICYEGLFDTLTRELAHKQAQVIVNITNDSWYDNRLQPWQHLAMSFSRAIEVRRPVIRATNTGHSGVIHLDASLDVISPMNQAWFYLYKVPYYKKPIKTLFMSFGYYTHEAFLIFLACFMFLISWRRSAQKL